MLHLLRILPWVTVAAVVGAAMPASAQLRPWQQGARPFALRSAPQTPAANPQPTARTAQVAVPQPAASPWLPQTVTDSEYQSAASRVTQHVAPSPGIRPIGHYPLPGESTSPQAPASLTAATLSAPHAPAQNPQAASTNAAPRNTASISPYAAAFLAAQQPTPAPPLTGPANAPMNATPLVEGNSQWTLPGLAGAPQSVQSPIPQGGSFDMLSPSCDPAEPEQVWEEPFDPGIPVQPARGCGPWFLSVSGLILSRGVPNNVELTSSSTNPEFTLINTERVGTDDWLGGVEFRLGRMIGDRWAIEFDYWSLEAQHELQSVYDPTNSLNSRLNFEELTYQGAPLSDVFDNSREQRFVRAWNAENIEINLLQQAMVVDPIDRFGMTMFGGVRYFRFDELWHYEAAAANSEFSDQDPNTQSNYWIQLKNRMVGWQVGGRGHVRIGNRLRLFAMPRLGVMGTRIGQQQHVCMIIDQHSTKNDVALLGQLDVGMSVQLLPCFSLFGSYRAMGIAGVAVGDDNVARSFESPATLESINSSSSLILHGWQIGAQWQF